MTLGQFLVRPVGVAQGALLGNVQKSMQGRFQGGDALEARAGQFAAGDVTPLEQVAGLEEGEIDQFSHATQQPPLPDAEHPRRGLVGGSRQRRFFFCYSDKCFNRGHGRLRDITAEPRHFLFQAFHSLA